MKLKNQSSISQNPIALFLFLILLIGIPQISRAEITTIAGDGTRGFSGDEGKAVRARLNLPASIAVTQNGTLYIADTHNHRIRRIDAKGYISTIVGDGTQGYYGDGGIATAAQLNMPTGIALDNFGNLYIADTGNHVIRKVDKDGYISTIAGNGIQGYQGDGGIATLAQLNAPTGVAIDNVGNLYIADTGNHVIRQLEKHTGNINSVTGKTISK